MKKILVTLMLVIISISLIQGLTPEEEKLLIEKGLTINKDASQIQIGDRIFVQNDPTQEGFVQKISLVGKPHYFLTKNVNIKTKEGILIQTPSVETHVIFEAVDSSTLSSLKNYISVVEEGSKKTIKVNGKDFKISYEKSNPPKLIIDENGNLKEGSSFTFGEDKEIELEGKKYFLLEGTKVRIEKDTFIFEFTKDGAVKIHGKEFKIKSTAEKISKFISDKEGNLLEGTTFTTQGANYILRGYRVMLTENSLVEYAKDKIIMSVAAGSQVIPTVENPQEVRGILEIKTKDAGFLATPGGKFQTLQEVSSGSYNTKQTSIMYVYENGKVRSYFTDKVAVFLNDKNEVDFSVFNPVANGEIDLVFDTSATNSLTRSSLMVTNTQIASLSDKGQGPVINILAGNRFGIGLNAAGKNELEPGKKTLSFQGIDGFAVLKKGDEGKISVLQLSGNSFYGPDKKSFFGYNKNFYYNPNALIGSVTHGDGTVALRTELLIDGKQLPVDIFSTNENGYVFVPPGQLKSPLEYYKGSKGTLVSNSVSFNQLSPRSRQLYTELVDNEQKTLSDDVKNNVASLEAKLTEIELKRSPLRASVDLSSCSGTLVGYLNDKPYVITAAHCVSGKGSSRTVYLNSLTNEAYSTDEYGGRGIAGTVVAYSSRGYDYDSTKDLALIELRPNVQQLEEIKKRGYVKIAPSIDYVKKGDSVVRIGCPGGTNNFRQTTCSVTGVDKTTGTDSLTATGNPWGGQSGGGLFKGRYLIGVVQSGGSGWGGYGNLQSIHKMLDDYGYSALYKIVIFLLV